MAKPAPKRVIVLGASNVSLNLPRIATMLRIEQVGDLELFVACGHGRSYGTTSRVLGRELCGIVSCELWPTVAERPKCPTSALITDVGNDILYGATPDQIMSWVGSAIDRCLAIGARVAITELPLQRVRLLGRRQFTVLRRLLFPRSNLSWPATLERVEELNQRLKELAHENSIHVVHQPRTWFGWDPIHVRRSARDEAFKTMLSAATGVQWQAPRVAIPLAFRGGSLRFVPLERKIFGIIQRHPQPCLAMSDGFTAWSY